MDSPRTKTKVRQRGKRFVRIEVGACGRRRPVASGAAVIRSRRPLLGVASAALRKAMTWTLAQRQPPVLVLVRAAGLFQWPARTGSTGPRTAPRPCRRCCASYPATEHSRPRRRWGRRRRHGCCEPGRCEPGPNACNGSQAGSHPQRARKLGPSAGFRPSSATGTCEPRTRISGLSLGLWRGPPARTVFPK